MGKLQAAPKMMSLSLLYQIENDQKIANYCVVVVELYVMLMAMDENSSLVNLAFLMRSFQPVLTISASIALAESGGGR